MTQRFSYYTDLSIEENLDFIARVYSIPDRNKRIQQCLDELGLSHRKTHLTGELSGGWKQRVALAAALLHQPALLLLDEPTAGVDPIARREFWDKIHMLSEQGITTLISTHYMDEAERCTRLAYLASGKLLITGTVNEVIAATHLITWELSGNITTSLLQKVKAIEGVIQAVLFGNKIHVCAAEEGHMDDLLARFCQQYHIDMARVPSTLEDAFINLVGKVGENLN